MDGGDHQGRVRVDTAPMGARSALTTPSRRVWPWYASGSACLTAALLVAMSDLGPSAAPPVSSAALAIPAALPAPAALTPSASTSTSTPPVEPEHEPALEHELEQDHEPELELEHEPDPLLAQGLNNLGFAARKDGDHASARFLYKEAMAADPRHVWSRYNLACELALSGESDPALALLGEVAQIGGADAAEALYQHAPRDKDFARLRADARFQALTTRP